MMISLIAAMANNRVIGLNGNMLWHLPADLAWFKQQTLYKPIIMGKNTFHSIGRPLPHRLNIVISRTEQAPSTEQLIWVSSLEQALEIANLQATEIMVIGGGNIYQQFLPLADKLYLTHINLSTTGDTFFPDYQRDSWQIEYTKSHKADDKNPYDYRFEILTRDTHPA